LQELWVEPKHHMGQETSAIDVKDLLLAAPVKAPTLEQLTSEVSASGLGASQAQVNFRARRGAASGSISTNTHAVGGGAGNGGVPSKATPAAAGEAPGDSPAEGPPQPPPSGRVAAASASTGSNGDKSVKTSNGHLPFVPAAVAPAREEGSTKSPIVAPAASPACVAIGPGCAGCAECDPLWLPPGRVQNCSMGGDPFVLAVLRPSQRVIDTLPTLLEGFEIKVR
ncbi:unnamed protein product, partial [Hapterophycus canaliculatus]